jgi:hypothetical protein
MYPLEVSMNDKKIGDDPAISSGVLHVLALFVFLVLANPRNTLT